MGHESMVDQRGMGKYLNWTTQVYYGAEMAVSVDPAWGDCTFDRGMLSQNSNHSTLQNYTRRWNKALRHDIGHSGKSARCDELGWVSVEEFIRNDHAWPLVRRQEGIQHLYQAIRRRSHRRKERSPHGRILVYPQLSACQKKAHDSTPTSIARRHA